MAAVDTPAWRLMPFSEVLARMPELQALYDQWLADQQDGEDYDEDEDSDEDGDVTQLVFFDGDTVLDRDTWERIRDETDVRLIAVNGNLRIRGGSAPNGCVRGDLDCDTAFPEFLFVGGTVHARQFVYLAAEDHEAVKPGLPLRVSAPLVMAWFHDVSRLELAPGGVLDILCGYNDYKAMGIQAPHFFWNDSLFALKPELCYAAHSDYSDAPNWNLDALRACADRGESYFIDGFDPVSLPLRRQADESLRTADYPTAFAQYRAAAELSPAWHPAPLGAGKALYHAGAYAQALPVLLEANARFPARHARLVDRALDVAAMCALRLRQLDLAIELSTRSITATRDNDMDREQRALAYRIRAEARLIHGDLEGAREDATRAAEWNWSKPVPHWLLGRVLYQLGEHKQAVQSQAKALKVGKPLYAAEFASNADTAFAYPAPTHVAWEGAGAFE